LFVVVVVVVVYLCIHACMYEYPCMVVCCGLTHCYVAERSLIPSCS
jgi:hypothetical protein